MITKEQIISVVEEFISDKDIFIVEVKVSPSSVVDVTVDSMTGVPIDVCIALNRFIESRFNRDEDDFELTVGSHSISDPFVVEQHYLKNIGRDVEIVLKSGEKPQGTLLSFSDNGIEIKYEKKETVEGKKRKQLVEVVEKIALEDIKSTKLIIKI